MRERALDVLIVPARLRADPPDVPRARLAEFFALTKPRITFLVILTGVPALLLAARGFPPLYLAGCLVLLLVSRGLALFSVPF